MKLTKKGKRCLLFVSVVILISVVAALSIAAFASNSNSEYITHIVEPNDTLWGIAEKYGNDGDIRKRIHEIKELNQLENCDLMVGTKLLICVS